MSLAPKQWMLVMVQTTTTTTIQRENHARNLDGDGGAVSTASPGGSCCHLLQASGDAVDIAAPCQAAAGPAGDESGRAHTGEP